MLNRFRKSLGMKGGRAAPAPPPSAVERQPPSIVDVTDADFVTVVEECEQLAVVDFWAEWCEPCRVMSAYVGFLANDFAGRVLVAALDVDENPATAERLNIMGLPTLLLVREGQEVGRLVGLVPYEQIKVQVEAALHL